MKLNEVIEVPDVMDPASAYDTTKVVHPFSPTQGEGLRQTSRRDSNMAKAKRIRALAKIKAKRANGPPLQGDGEHNYALGGTTSTFLNR